MNIFIDTNIYLNFYHLSNEDLEELGKISVLQKNHRITVYLTRQIKDEFERNREKTIQDALKRFQKDNFNNDIPQMVKGYEEYEELRKAIISFSKAKLTILSKMNIDISNNSLKADSIISDIFSKSKMVEISDDIFQKAEVRHKRGNPPGKKDSLGDALNWEMMFEAVEQQDIFSASADTDLHIISDDGDFFSELESSKPKPYLVQEWFNKKQGRLFAYRRISQFTSQYFPDIKLATELEKEINIENLRTSGSYASTHGVIATLRNCSDFTDSQVNEIVNAYLCNSQVYWIIGDEDVLAFVLYLIERYEKVIEISNLKNLTRILPDTVENTELSEKMQVIKNLQQLQ